MAQLVAVGDLLKAKLEILGFGNLLAKHVTKVHDAYKHMDLAVPADFLQPRSAESMTELLESVSSALQDGTKAVRITGTYALGHILGLILVMFPPDTLVTVMDLYFSRARVNRSLLGLRQVVRVLKYRLNRAGRK